MMGAPASGLPAPMRIHAISALFLLGMVAANPIQAQSTKSAPARVEERATVAPGKIAEWCAKLAAGQLVRYRFDADAPLDFNIHAHEGDQVIYGARREAVERLDFSDFKPRTAADWCWMWTNRTEAPVEVRYLLYVGQRPKARSARKPQ